MDNSMGIYYGSGGGLDRGGQREEIEKTVIA